MTPRDHKRTLGLLHGLIGILILTGLVVAAMFEVRRHPSDAAEKLQWMLYVLPLPLLQLSAAYGLFTVRKWGRRFVLILCVLYVWIFPLGTLLAAYTWWFMHTAGARRLYGAAPSPDPSER